MPEDRANYDTEPGFGAYIPPLQPHWIMNGPTPSVSMTFIFTRDTDEDSLVRSFNQHLITRGRRATPPGRSLGKDAAKVAVMRLAGLRNRSGYGADEEGPE